MAKKSRKEEYAENHTPENLNPSGLQEKDILKGLKDKTIVPGPPPKGKRCTSAQWKMGLKFLFSVEDDESLTEIKNWYFCEICGWLQNAKLGGGTGNLLQHVRKHDQPKYKFTKDALVALLIKTAEFTQATGSIANFKQLLPSPDNW